MHIINAWITWVSNYKSSNSVPIIGHPHNCALITLKIGAQRTNYNQECHWITIKCHWIQFNNQMSLNSKNPRFFFVIMNFIKHKSVTNQTDISWCMIICHKFWAIIRSFRNYAIFWIMIIYGSRKFAEIFPMIFPFINRLN